MYRYILLVSILLLSRSSGELPLSVYIASLLNSGQFPGGVVGVQYADGVREVISEGYADVRARVAVDRETVFNIASVSKPITAMIIMRLIEMGRLGLSDQLVALLPEFEYARVGGYPEVKVVHLLRHTAGWDREVTFDPLYPGFDLSRIGLSDGSTCQGVAKAMLQHGLQFHPGTRYAYSNLGYCLLSLIVEKKVGKPYFESAKELLLNPLRVSGVQGPDGYKTGRSLNYQKQGRNWAVVDVGAASLQRLSGAGGWASTVDALLDLFQRGPVYPIVSAKALAQHGSNFYGYGWRVWPRADGQADLTHFGAMPGCFSFVLRMAEGHIVVALFNARPRDADALSRQMYQSISSALRVR
ncbi:serine hydrolase [Pseudomonas sp. D(2018)]|uniref:serine hydrolase domain-containing protein n=1 Tax=Pseudomonas sp. D(2018) TaxID=2502238 RepID=UPI0010F9EA67|nr:serine hydrolase domain-containing protein [Pseudomonas sp. D(2018)]